MSTLPKGNQDKVGFHFEKDSHTYTFDGKRMTGVTSVISVLNKPQLIPWAARMAVECIQSISEYKTLENGNRVYTVFEHELEQAKSAHTKKKEEAGAHGTDSHALVEEWITLCIENKGGVPDRSIGYDSRIDKFAKWAYENVDHFLFSERQMFNKDMFLAGTADFGCVMKDGKKLIGDWKTSSGVYGIDYFLQCAGYKILAEAEGDAPYDGCVIVRQGKKGADDFDVHYRYAEASTKESSTDLWNRLMGFIGAKQTEVINYSDVDAKAFMACLTIYRAQATFKKPNYK